MARGLELGDLLGPFQPKPVYDSTKSYSVQTADPVSQRVGSSKDQKAGQNLKMPVKGFIPHSLLALHKQVISSEVISSVH